MFLYTNIKIRYISKLVNCYVNLLIKQLVYIQTKPLTKSLTNIMVIY